MEKYHAHTRETTQRAKTVKMWLKTRFVPKIGGSDSPIKIPKLDTMSTISRMLKSVTLVRPAATDDATALARRAAPAATRAMLDRRLPPPRGAATATIAPPPPPPPPPPPRVIASMPPARAA
jgi:hypothetical protein